MNINLERSSDIPEDGGGGPAPLSPSFDNHNTTEKGPNQDFRADTSQMSQDGKSDIEMSSRQRSSLSSESLSARRNSDQDQQYRKTDSPVFGSCMSPTQMKSEDSAGGSHPNLTPLLSLGLSNSPGQRMSLSPKLDTAQFHASPSVLPRRSRGLDWSRACSSLHQSTLATPATATAPAASVRGTSVPRRRARAGSFNAGSPLLGMQSSSATDKPDDTNSHGSHFRMVQSESDSDDEDDDDDSGLNPSEDTFMSTPRPLRMINHLSLPTFSPTQSPGSAAKRDSFSSALNGRYSFDDSPLPRSSLGIINTSTDDHETPGSSTVIDSNEIQHNEQSRKMMLDDIKRRRESLGYIIPDFQSTYSNDDDQGGGKTEDQPSRSNTPDSGRHGIFKRPISRPRNLLPKPKPFSRIRAQLMEEGAPLDFDTKREAEVMRQVRENDPQWEAPSLEQARISTQDDSENARYPMSMPDNSHTPPSPPSRQDSDNAMETPPPPPANFSSSFSGYPVPYSYESPRPTNKRRRDDGADSMAFKRRAVSPSVSSVHSSPKISPHPRNGSVLSELGTGNTAGTSEASGKSHEGKRTGAHGVTETNDGFMNMRLD